jgi:hypothetical protein
MKRIILALAALGLASFSHAQLWSGNALPPDWIFPSNGVDSYFSTGDVGGAGVTEFDADTGIEFSLQEFGTKPADIDIAHGWSNAANFAVTLEDGDNVVITYLGKTAGWKNDFGMNLGGMNAEGHGGDPYTLWSTIDNDSPMIGDHYSFGLVSGGPLTLDFWLNSGGPDAPVEPALGGTYSIFYPGTSNPDNTGLPDYDFSALGKLFNVNDSFTGEDRTILVVAIEDWRNFDADFTDMFFAIEIYDRDGNSQFPVPEPSTYGMIGAMLLLGLAAFRRARRS